MVRSRSVSKLWSSITTDPVFINSFETKSSPRTLLIFRKYQKLFVFSSPLHKNDHLHDPYPQKEYCEFTIPNIGYLKRYDSVHGLICLETSTQLMVWNPTTRCLFSLPNPECNERKLGYVLGYDPIDVKYKALCILTGNKIGIRTLGAQESWRIISIGCPKHNPTMFNCRCINGVIYYVAFICSTRNHAIMSFELRSEKLSLFKYPMDNLQCFLASYEERLALVRSIESGAELWVLEDAENHKWICKHFTSHPPPYKQWELKGVTDDGEYIYIYTLPCTYRCDLGYGPDVLVSPEKSLYESFSVAYFDPKKNSLRHVEFGGIACEDIRRLDEVGFDLQNQLFVIPNHVECLMSSL